MKAKLFLFSFTALTLLTLAHIQWNVGWDTLVRDVKERMGAERKTLMVGFLPVT